MTHHSDIVFGDHVRMPPWARLLETLLVRIDEEVKSGFDSKPMPAVSTILTLLIYSL